MAEYYLAYEVQAEPDQIPADYAEYIARSVERGFADTIFEQLESGEKIFTLDPFVTKFRPETMSTQWKQKLTVQDLVRCKDCKYNPDKPRLYSDDDTIETFIHCQFMQEDDFCSKGKRSEQ